MLEELIRKLIKLTSSSREQALVYKMNKSKFKQTHNGRKVRCFCGDKIGHIKSHQRKIKMDMQNDKEKCWDGEEEKMPILWI